MDDPAAIAIVTVAIISLGFLVPIMAKRRQDMADTPIEERFSPLAHVVDCSDVSPVHSHEQRSTGALLTLRGGPHMNRPQLRGSAIIQPESAVEAVASEHADEQLTSQRAAAARRRMILAVVCLIAAAVTGVLAAVSTIVWAVAAVVLLLGFVSVLVQGRRVVLAQQRADAIRELEAQEAVDYVPAHAVSAYRQRQAAMAAHPARGAEAELDGLLLMEQSDEVSVTVTQTETVETVAQTQIVPAVDADIPAAPVRVSAQQPAAPVDETLSTESSDSTWQPVLVPAPTYTLKANGPHWSPAPLSDEDFAAAQAAAKALTQREEPTTTARISLPPRTVFGEAIDIDEVLERRRAVGE